MLKSLVNYLLSPLKEEQLEQARQSAHQQLLQEWQQALSDVRSRRLTLEDLQLQPGEILTLRQASAALRKALFKAGEHVCLTTEKECCRQTAVKYREYQRQITLTKANKVPELDATPEDISREKMKRYFPKKNADPA